MARGKKICSVPGCGRGGRNHKGMCQAHYYRQSRHGDVMAHIPIAGSKACIKPIRIEGNVAYVTLTQGYEALIDAEDAARVGEHNWHAVVDGTTVYALAPNPDNRQRKIGLHNFVLGVASRTDHVNGDGLDNRKTNLRSVTHHQNMMNKRAPSSNTSGYKGVRFASWAKGQNQWRAGITVNGRYISLGYHPTKERAAKAYNVAATRFFGEYARMNELDDVHG